MLYVATCSTSEHVIHIRTSAGPWDQFYQNYYSVICLIYVAMPGARGVAAQVYKSAFAHCVAIVTGNTALLMDRCRRKIYLH